MSIPLKFNISCDGEFTIDEKGIRSKDPISVKSSAWLRNMLALDCHGNNIGRTNISSNFGGTMINAGNNQTVYVNGETIEPKFNIMNKSYAQIFNEEFDFFVIEL